MVRPDRQSADTGHAEDALLIQNPRMKIPPLHPFAFVVFPILSLYSHNLGLFPWTDVLRPIGLGIVLTGAVYLLSWALLSAIHHSPFTIDASQAAAAVTSILVFEFFTFGYLWTAFQKLELKWLF